MYLRRKRRSKNGASYDYWSLVESVRTASGPRQRTVATLGKLPEYDEDERMGWEEIGRILDGKPEKQADLFQSAAETSHWTEVDVRSVSVERLRHFGDVFLGLALWRRLKLHEAFESLQPAGREEIGWPLIACILTIARLCQPGSKLQLAESWYPKTALDDLLGVASDKINDDRLYRGMDAMLSHRETICRHLQDQYGEWFGTTFDFMLYDVTSTYFEGLGGRNRQAKRGYSRDHRSDCLQICVGLIVTIEGLPVAYEVFDGNRTDVTTMSEVVETLETKYGKARRVWVFDRGVVSEANLDELRERGASYVVGTPRSMLKKFEFELLDDNWERAQFGVDVKLVEHPDFGNEKFILCRSERRAEKEAAILNKKADLLEAELYKIRKSIRSGLLKDSTKANRRIGRWLGKYSRAESLFEANLIEEDGLPIDLEITRRENVTSWAELSQGSYLLRTNLNEESPSRLWRIYVQLNQAESAFRICKSDLGIRPVHHQKEDRVQSHVFICFLALVMWRCLEQWTNLQGLGTSARVLLEELRELKSLDVVLPVKGSAPIRLRTVAKPDPHAQILLQKMGLKLPGRTRMIKT